MTAASDKASGLAFTTRRSSVRPPPRGISLIATNIRCEASNDAFIRAVKTASLARHTSRPILTNLFLSGPGDFQSFGQGPTAIAFEAMIFLLGPNGTGKTAVIQALARLFGFDPSLRRVRRTDFHIAAADLAKDDVGPLTLWIEAQFEFPELKKPKGKHATIPV